MAAQAENSGDLNQARNLYEQAQRIEYDSNRQAKITELTQKINSTKPKEQLADNAYNVSGANPALKNAATQRQADEEKIKAQDEADKKKREQERVNAENEKKRRIQAQKQRQRELEANKKKLAKATAGVFEGISNGSLNMGLRFTGSESAKYKDTFVPTTMGIMFGYISGHGMETRKINNGYTWGFIFSANFTIEEETTLDYIGNSEISSFGAQFGLGVFKIVEIMPTVGIQWVSYRYSVGAKEDFKNAFDEIEYPISVGVMGRLLDMFYTFEYDFTFESVSFGFGFHFGRR